jgi:transcriptional regulator with XRE-family HTH domain
VDEYAPQVFSRQPLTRICGPRILSGVSIGANLKRLRERAGMTQDALGKAAAVKQSDISKWETKGQVPTVRPLMRLATALGVSIDQILVGVDELYDSVLHNARADSTHATGSVKMTPSVRVGDVQQGAGDPDVAVGTIDRLSQSSPSEDAEVQRDLGEMDAIWRIIEYADAIGELARPLRALPEEPTTTRSDKAGRGARHGTVRHASPATRRGAR